MGKNKSRNHQFEVRSTNGSDLAFIQQTVCTQLAHIVQHVVVSTIETTQHILIQISKARRKMRSKEVEEKIVLLYPATLAVSCTTIVPRNNMKRVASRMTRHTRIPPSITNFKHVDLAMTWQVRSYADAHFSRGMIMQALGTTTTTTTMTTTTTTLLLLTTTTKTEAAEKMRDLVSELSAAARTDQYFYKFGGLRAKALKMFKAYVSEIAGEFVNFISAALWPPTSSLESSSSSSSYSSKSRSWWTTANRECFNNLLTLGSRTEQLAFVERLDRELEELKGDNAKKIQTKNTIDNQFRHRSSEFIDSSSNSSSSSSSEFDDKCDSDDDSDDNDDDVTNKQQMGLDKLKC